MTIKWLSSQEAADLIGVSYLTMYKYIRAGKIKAFKNGKNYKLKEEDVMAFIESCAV
jgi:excisionase family DNA binding protein